MKQVKLTWQLKLLLWLERFALPVWRYALKRRLKRGKETQHSYEQKLMLHRSAAQSMPAQPHPLIWGHAVGVGELLALLGVFRRLSEHLPEHHFLLTSTSRTSGMAIAQQNLGARFHHQFAPIDHPQVLADFFDAWQPELACWSETDLWPGMVWLAHQRRIPMLMLNARVDAEKSRRIRRHAWFYQPLLQCFHQIYAQNPESHQQLQGLSGDSALAKKTGNIKALAPALRYEPDQLAQYRSMCAARPIWLLASSHQGEEEIAIQAHQLLRKSHADALLIVVPRDAFRGAEIAKLSIEHGFETGLRSQFEHPEASCDVYVADTMGELGLWYALCSVALVGGSMVPVGGHNPYEAIAAQCRVLSGTHIQNFSESYQALHALGLAQTISDPQDICEAVQRSWALPRLAIDANQSAETLLHDILQIIKNCRAH